ncbi:MAG TPA: hypothetical protein VJB94_01085 [Candidatus Nanoarchaeia archaeon]|nr:hypothetical protein [Candidatus Nanoarchaeia archaeon]
MGKTTSEKHSILAYCVTNQFLASIKGRKYRKLELFIGPSIEELLYNIEPVNEKSLDEMEDLFVRRFNVPMEELRNKVTESLRIYGLIHEGRIKAHGEFSFYTQYYLLKHKKDIYKTLNSLSV